MTRPDQAGVCDDYAAAGAASPRLIKETPLYSGGGRELTADGCTQPRRHHQAVGLLFDFGSHDFGRSPNHEKKSSAFESRCDEMLSEAEAAAQLKIKRALARDQDWH